MATKTQSKTAWRMALSVAHRGPRAGTKSYRVQRAPKVPSMNSKVKWR